MLHIGPVRIGGGAPLALIAGLNVLESSRDAIEFALALQALAERRAIPLVFKASWDKANRTSHASYRGPGLDEGIEILRDVKRATDLPLLTDVHEPHQAKPLAAVVDCLQIPAFLCRQTDLIKACAATDLPLNVKKGQFLGPRDVPYIVEKIRTWGRGGVMLTERGTSFGYDDLVVDMRALGPVLGNRKDFVGRHSLPPHQGESTMRAHFHARPLGRHYRHRFRTGQSAFRPRQVDAGKAGTLTRPSGRSPAPARAARRASGRRR